MGPESVFASFLVSDFVLLNSMQPPKFDDKETSERVATPGVSVGLVWTSFGGEVQFVEASSMVGKGELHLTGQLGDVIKESAQIALTWVSSHIISFIYYLRKIEQKSMEEY